MQTPKQRYEAGAGSGYNALSITPETASNIKIGSFVVVASDLMLRIDSMTMSPSELSSGRGLFPIPYVLAAALLSAAMAVFEKN